MEWETYPAEGDGVEHTVVGTVKILREVQSPELENVRDLLAYLPPSYGDGDRRYPVIYMHDGQNLFDQATSFGGEWRVDETMEAEGVEAIVIGVPNMGEERCEEYSPWVDAKAGGGCGDDYLEFLVRTVKPLVDESFRTLPDREHTGIVGSSMGGLISLYGFFREPDTFGFAGVMSPSLWFAQGAIFPFVQAATTEAGKIHLDIGTYEGPDMSDRHHLPPTYVGRHILSLRQMRDLLIQKGYRDGVDINYEEAPEAVHNEMSWARRLPGALRFLLAEQAVYDAASPRL